MTDKERILICLVNRLYARALYSREDLSNWREIQPGIFSGNNRLQKGDLVTAQTTFTPNEFMVGYVEDVRPNCVVIREIGGKKLCNYYNESFMKIDKQILGYEILEGVQYKTYQKVLKAFSNSDFFHSYRFKSITFDNDICTVESRKSFTNNAIFQIKFKYNSTTTIKSILKLINNEERKANRMNGDAE